MNDQNRVFQDQNEQRQRAEMPSPEQDKFLAELAIVHFMWLASHGMTSTPDVVTAKEALRTLGVKL